VDSRAWKTENRKQSTDGERWMTSDKTEFGISFTCSFMFYSAKVTKIGDETERIALFLVK
jgi:hypothetical protein